MVGDHGEFAAGDEVPDNWTKWMDQFAETSFRAYRRLIEHPAFGRFFRLVTPITDIEQLQIASRPARRAASDRIEDLRAIPWVFAWTQCRCLIPAWYGLGAALGDHLQASPERSKKSAACTASGRSSGRRSTTPCWPSPSRIGKCFVAMSNWQAKILIAGNRGDDRGGVATADEVAAHSDRLR